MKPQWINFPVRGDERGQLVPMEAEQTVPFAIQRVYTISGVGAGKVRGAHAHHTLCQVVVALVGECRIRLDDGGEETEIELRGSSRGLILDPMVWHEMGSFSPDCVLLVLASEHYEEADYIRDRDDYLKLMAASRR